MASLFRATSRWSLALNIAAAVGLAVIGNGVIALFGWRASNDGTISPSFAPPGAVIGIVWTLLFAAMGAARWLVVRDDGDTGRRNSRWVTGLLLACFAYPYYTLGFRSEVSGLIGSIVTAIAAAIIAWRIAGQSRMAAALVALTSFWCLFASLMLIRMLQINP